jgi:pectin methylesterase-like acyl-CoA thioesterase
LRERIFSTQGQAFGFPIRVRLVINRPQRGVCALLCACACGAAFVAANNAAARDYFVNRNGGEGVFPTVQSAVDAVEEQTATDRANIFIAPGRYVEQVTIDKPFVTFIGQGATPADVSISFAGAPFIQPFVSYNATVTLNSNAIEFMARNLTFENSLPDRNEAAGLALASLPDRAIFDNVRFLGYQDTLLASGDTRQYFRDSFISGDADFIYGNATAVFDRCTIESTDFGWITAADTKTTTANGLIFLDCSLVKGTDRNPFVDDRTTPPNDSVFLGRPWLEPGEDVTPSVIYIRTRMGPHIKRAGWDPWVDLSPLLDRDSHTRISEWGSMDLSGSLLADMNQDGIPNGRVSWVDPISVEQAANYTLKNIFGPADFWNGATQPQTSGLSYASQGEPWDPLRQLLTLPAKPGAHSQMLNISTRLRAGTGDNVGIAGFIVTGTAPKKLIIRGIGASLREAGLADALADPVLKLYGADGHLIAENDDWKDDDAAWELTARGLAPTHDLEAALLVELPPGQYTAIIGGRDEASGTGLIEVYDADLAADSELANISTRGFVGTNDDVMIGGFVIGNSSGFARVLVRALGPSLAESNVHGTLPDSILELHDADGNITANDDWRATSEMKELPPSLQPEDDRESILLATLAAGPHTAIVRGKNDTTGVGLIEVYNLR